MGLAPVLELPKPCSGAVPDRGTYTGWAVSCTRGCWALNLTQLHKTRHHPSLGFFKQCGGFIPFCGQKLTTLFLKSKGKVWTMLCLNGKHHTWVMPIRTKICAEARLVPNISLFCSSTYCNWFFCLFYSRYCNKLMPNFNCDMLNYSLVIVKGFIIIDTIFSCRSSLFQKHRVSRISAGSVCSLSLRSHWDV